MRSRVVDGAGVLTLVWLLSAAALPRAQGPPVPPPPSSQSGEAVKKAPIYVVLQTTIDDVINAPVSMERLPRAIKAVEHLQAGAAAFHPACLFQFNGVAADLVAAENFSTHYTEALKDYASRGLVEIGYDGTEEPTFPARPRPNLRGADTPEKRWLARLQATEWFLTEWKHPLTGEPDASRSGGLKRVREVFGRVDFARGATFEPWYAGELVHSLEALGLRPALAGFLEPTVYPTRNLDGYRGGAPGISDLLAPDDRCAPEVFWLDTALRVSDYGALGGRVFNAYEGPEELAKMLAGLDRSRLHVVQVRIGHPAVYVKPGFGAKNYQTALEYSYDNPKLPNLPAAAARSAEERAEMYAREDAVLDWLVKTFFPANAGSRFVSVGALMSQAGPGDSAPVTQGDLREAATQLVESARKELVRLPPFVKGGSRYFSLADLFGLLTGALGETAASGARPSSIPMVRLVGPVAIEDANQTTGVRVSTAALVRECAELRRRLTASGWSPVPRNAVPSSVTVGGVHLTAAQFLLAMADAYAAGAGTAEVEVKWVSGTTLIGAMLPESRPRMDGGSAWTFRPAPIRFPE